MVKKNLMMADKLKLSKQITTAQKALVKAREKLNKNDLVNFRNNLQVAEVGARFLIKKSKEFK